MTLLFQKSKGCSQCCEGTLEIKNPAPTNGADETQTSGDPDARAYYECDRCGFRVKEFIDGRTEIPDNDEWDQFCE